MRLATAIPGEDSGSDQSLGYKSAAHGRTPHGRIIHGKWECSSVFLDVAERDGPDRGSYHISRRVIRAGATGASHISDSAKQMLAIYPRGTTPAVARVSGPVGDPDLSSFESLGMMFATHSVHRSFDTGFRSLAKWHNMHLRFDDEELGTLAAEEWRSAFESELISFLNRNQNQNLQVTFDAALIRQRIRPVAPTIKPSNRKRADFGQWDDS